MDSLTDLILRNFDIGKQKRDTNSVERLGFWCRRPQRMGTEKKEIKESPAPMPTVSPIPIVSPSAQDPRKLMPMPYSEFELHEEINSRYPGLPIDFVSTAKLLKENGTITDGDKLLRGEKSSKISWDIGLSDEMQFDRMGCCFLGEDVKTRVQQYFNSGRESEFFDVDQLARPEELLEGPYLLYPGDEYPQLMKYQSYIEPLAKAAVEYHKYLTGSNIEFLAVKKANVFSNLSFHTYFITLEVKCEDEDAPVTCRSRVACLLDMYDDFPYVHGKSSIEEVHVESFKFGN